MTGRDVDYGLIRAESTRAIERILKLPTTRDAAADLKLFSVVFGTVEKSVGHGALCVSSPERCRQCGTKTTPRRAGPNIWPETWGGLLMPVDCQIRMKSFYKKPFVC